MGIVQKRADQLKPGDVITGLPPSLAAQTATPCIVLLNGGPHGLRVWDTLRQGQDELRPMPATLVDVESLPLTPAQEHAEELKGYLERIASGRITNTEQLVNLARTALELVTPPEPTLAEALAVLAGVSHLLPSAEEASRNVLDILDRARRAGMLK